MHDCKAAKEDLIEIALRGWIPSPNELGEGPHCREEIAALHSTAQIAGAAMQLVQPGEDFWPGYRARLQQRLAADAGASRPLPRGTRLAIWLRKLATASVPVPAPIALAMLAFIGFSIFFLLPARSTSKVAPAPAPPALVTQTIEVPVIQEKQVMRIVDRRAARQSAASPEPRLTRALNSPAPAIPLAPSLDGFKPVHEARLTLINGSRDEK